MYNDDNINYYDVLEIDSKASADDIKKSFRRLSLIYHPDRDSGDETKFKNITTAYEVLSNPDKRRTYDMENSMPFKNFNAGSFSNDDLINIIFQSEANDIGSLFSNKRKPVVPKKPNVITKTMRITLEQAYTGCILPLLIERKNNKTTETETIYVTVPQGVDDNEFITIEKKGNIVEEHCGDVKVIVMIENNTVYNRKGLDLTYTHDITLKDALCGCSFEMKHISGKTLNFTNNQGNIITPSFIKTINNYGFIRENHTGNLIISFNIIFPPTLSVKQIADINNIL